MDEPTLSDQEKEIAKFLDRDFNQCFQQMRYYDGQIVDICKFAFTSYIAVAGGALALYKYGMEKNINYTLPAVAVLCLVAVFGFILLGLVVRNRVYFVLMARYLNEHRAFFLKDKPLEFANKSHMFTDYMEPPYLRWLSSQLWVIYSIVLLNATMIGIAGLLLCLDWDKGREWCLFPALAALVAQLIGSVRYLQTREKKSAVLSW
jgi:hypothetical protein